ncbi:MAG: glutamine synthetase family protein [Gaiella sp.]
MSDASALAVHREQNLMEATVTAIEEQIAAAGVEFLYYQFVSINGRVLTKVAPARHLRRNLASGVNFHGSAVADVAVDRSGEIFAGGAQAEEFTALPDPETFRVLPWERTTGRFLCRLYRRADADPNPGASLPTDTRGLLRRAHAVFEQATGYELRAGLEPEMTWEGESIDVTARPGVSPAYHLGSLEKVREIYQRVIRYGQALGLEMVEGDYEDNGQLELNFHFDRAETTADRLVTYRQICARVATELGVTATFMPKPTLGVMGNGCHHNISLWRDGTNAFSEPGREDLHVSAVARKAVGGLLTHSSAGMAVYASTVNSYKRYWDTGLFAPSRVNWGLDNRTCTVRVSANGRLEFKLPDAIVNPYLSLTLVLAAIADGLGRDLDPGEPVARGELAAAANGFDPLPLTLGEAIDRFAASAAAEALGPELTGLYLDFKRDEWARYCSAITDWEREMYREWLP